MRRTPSSLSRAALLFFAALTAVFVGLAPLGCTAEQAACDSTKCAAGNTCLDDGATGSKCRLLCTTQSGCPGGYHCAPTPDGSQSFCAQDKDTVVHEQGTGGWGTSCLTTGGLDQNPGCASNDGFWCYGKSPTDANSYCTQYGCGSDDDCAGGFWCATINVFPDVRVAKRSFGDTQTACLKRDYCSPCRGDFDCPTSMDGQATHCLAGNDGAKFCTKECTRNSHCQLDAACAANDDLGVKVCTPRAGTCRGDGSLCSPCRSDADCGSGFCIEQQYSHERYCTVASPVPCKEVNGKLESQCPTSARGASTEVTCATTPDYGIPVNQCFGIVEFGSNGGEPSYADGCWTDNSTRK